MTSVQKIVLLGASIAAIAGASVVWWVHRQKAMEWKTLSEVASEMRARAE
jgi:hypothetical protein